MKFCRSLIIGLTAAVMLNGEGAALAGSFGAFFPSAAVSESGGEEQESALEVIELKEVRLRLKVWEILEELLGIVR
ncbi:MAG: hypothetical protein IJ806_02295 [Ruminococcus sp.]|nr:hypothetical protein [Ruminococcus sp.]